MRILKRLNPVWTKMMLDKMKAAKDVTNPIPFPAVTTAENLVASWLVINLATNGLTPEVKNLGAGVKRVSVVGQCCPTCGKEV